MSDHLPECPESDADWLANWWDSVPCICDRLRACEQRVREDGLYVSGVNVGYASGLDAARDAVAAQGIVTANLVRLDAALAAIDALRRG